MVVFYEVLVWNWPVECLGLCLLVLGVGFENGGRTQEEREKRRGYYYSRIHPRFYQTELMNPLPLAALGRTPPSDCR